MPSNSTQTPPPGALDAVTPSQTCLLFDDMGVQTAF